jgi:hypothetical protein
MGKWWTFSATTGKRPGASSVPEGGRREEKGRRQKAEGRRMKDEGGRPETSDEQRATSHSFQARQKAEGKKRAT